MTVHRPGQKLIAVPGPDVGGVRFVQPAAMPADWWDPNREGLSVVAAYRAINSAGTPWPGGPANYAESLVNQANPGVNDLTEGNGAVPWAAATGWQFTAAAAQYFDTGIIPAIGYTALAQFSGATTGIFSCLFGCMRAVAPPLYFGAFSSLNVSLHGYHAGGTVNVVPWLVAGNMCVAGQDGYLDGLWETAIPPNAFPPFSIYLGVRNNSGVPQAGLYYQGNYHAAVIYDAAPTAPQVLAVATAMAAL